MSQLLRRGACATAAIQFITDYSTHTKQMKETGVPMDQRRKQWDKILNNGGAYFAGKLSARFGDTIRFAPTTNAKIQQRIHRFLDKCERLPVGVDTSSKRRCLLYECVLGVLFIYEANAVVQPLPQIQRRRPTKQKVEH